MDKQLYIYDGMPLSFKKEQTTDVDNNMIEAQELCTERRLHKKVCMIPLMQNRAVGKINL